MTYVQNTITYFYMYLNKGSYVTIIPVSIVYKITIDYIAKQTSFWYNKYVYTSKLWYSSFNNCMFQSYKQVFHIFYILSTDLFTTLWIFTTQSSILFMSSFSLSNF